MISASTFGSNTATSNTIFFIYANDNIIKDCYFEDNNSTTLSKNIFVGFSNLTITNTVFSDNQEYLINLN